MPVSPPTGVFVNAARQGGDVSPVGIDAVLFDCDGVLIDSEALAVGDLMAQINAVSDMASCPLDIAASISTYAGWSGGEIVRHIAAETGVPLDVNAIMSAHDRSVPNLLSNNVETFDGMSDVLSFLHAAVGRRMAVITSSDTARVIPSLVRTGLRDFFVHHGVSQIYCAPQICPDRRKPHPDIYLHGIKQLKADAARSVAIEDSVAGVTAARRAEVGHIVGFVGGAHYPAARKEEFADRLIKAGAHNVIADIRALPEVLPLRGRPEGLKSAISAPAARLTRALV